jgi:hypothetical protein
MVIDLVYHVDLSGRTLAMLSFSSACYMIDRQAVVIASKATRSCRSAGASASSRLLAVVEHGKCSGIGGTRVVVVVTTIVFAIALQLRLRGGVVPDQQSIMTITGLPFETEPRDLVRFGLTETS